MARIQNFPKCEVLLADGGKKKLERGYNYVYCSKHHLAKLILIIKAKLVSQLRLTQVFYNCLFTDLALGVSLRQDGSKARELSQIQQFFLILTQGSPILLKIRAKFHFPTHCHLVVFLFLFRYHPILSFFLPLTLAYFM